MYAASKENCWVAGTHPLEAREECHICDVEYAGQVFPTRRQKGLIWMMRWRGAAAGHTLGYGG